MSDFMKSDFFSYVSVFEIADIRISALKLFLEKLNEYEKQC